MTPEALILACLTGFAFGTIAHWLWCWSGTKVAAVLFLVWATTTLAQLLWRIFSGTGTVDELITITMLRAAMATCAVIAADILHGRCD